MAGNIPDRIAAALLLVFSVSAGAGVYKWVDENGQVHYGDAPQGESSEQLDLNNKKADPAADNETGRREYRKKLLDSYATERKQKQEQKAKQEEQQAEQKQRCDQARKRLYDYEHAAFLYDRDKKTGERAILNDEQHKAAMENARAAVKRYCK